jgi:uncharacterized protein with PQ loop repeat
VFVSGVGLLFSLGYYSQAYRIWKKKSVEDISLLSFSIFVIGTSVWLAYGFYKHDVAIISSFFFGAIGSWLVFGLTLYYRKRS